MTHNDMSNIDFNKLAAFCDAQLPPDQMTKYEQFVSSNPALSSMLDDIDKIDMDITDNICSDEVMDEAQCIDVVLPEIEETTNTFGFSEITDSFDNPPFSLSIEDASLTETDNILDDLDESLFGGESDNDL